MDTKTLEALEASIKHWQEMLAEPDPRKIHPLASRCALCWTFRESPDGECVGCPVAEASAKHGCLDTPYTEAARAWRRWIRGVRGGSREAFLAAAQAELAFLQSLLSGAKPFDLTPYQEEE